jgi:hypothetical protein
MRYRGLEKLGRFSRDHFAAIPYWRHSIFKLSIHSIVLLLRKIFRHQFWNHIVSDRAAVCIYCYTAFELIHSVISPHFPLSAEISLEWIVSVAAVYWILLNGLDPVEFLSAMAAIQLFSPWWRHCITSVAILDALTYPNHIGSLSGGLIWFTFLLDMVAILDSFALCGHTGLAHIWWPNWIHLFWSISTVFTFTCTWWPYWIKIGGQTE